MAFDRFSDGGAAIFLPKQFAMPPSQPVPARFYSGHFCFGPGSFAQEVQHDPEFYFIGEEISLSVRAYTHGYDLFHPHQAVIWHEYTRAGRPKHWDDHEGENQLANWVELDALSKGRNRSLLNMDSVQTKSATLGRFGLGTVRSLHDYERFAGIDFSTASVSRHLLENLPPPGPDAELSIQEWQSQLLRQHVIAARLNEQLMDQVRSSDKLNISVLNDDDEIIHTEAFDSAKIGEIALDETLRFEVTCFSQDAPRLLLVEPEHTDGRLDSPFALVIDASKG